jgi:hypothetical protein
MAASDFPKIKNQKSAFINRQSSGGGSGGGEDAAVDGEIKDLVEVGDVEGPASPRAMPGQVLRSWSGGGST